MNEKFKELYEDVLDEVAAIEETLDRPCEVRKKFDTQVKDYCIEPAMGTYLMNFYNGVENILKRVSKEYYKIIPKGPSWHKELIVLSCNPPEGKVAIFSQSIVEKLNQYRNFRHRFVSGYGFQLKGEKMLELIDNIGPLWDDIKKSIKDFWETF